MSRSPSARREMRRLVKGYREAGLPIGKAIGQAAADLRRRGFKVR